MRTTLNIDDDVLAAARQTARRESKSVGEVISAAARTALTRTPDGLDLRERNGFPVLPARGTIVTNEMIDKIRDEIGA